MEIYASTSCLTVVPLKGSPTLITQTAEYALRATVYLADQNQAQTSRQIADKTQVPAGYLSKVMQELNRAGVVRAQRGLGGGFSLAKPAEQLTVLEVVQAVDPVRRIHECPLGVHGKKLCPLHRKLDDAAKLIEQSFGETTLADLAGGNRRALCALPTA